MEEYYRGNLQKAGPLSEMTVSIPVLITQDNAATSASVSPELPPGPLVES